MSENFDVMGGDPEGKPQTGGMVVTQTAKSSFEFEVLCRSREAMTLAYAEFGRDNNDVEFIEDEPDAISSSCRHSEPMDPARLELLTIEDEILSATATLWVTRVAIARATKNEIDYRAACAAENIEPF